MSENDRKNSSAEVSVLQEGGDLAHFGKILNAGATVNCSLDTWDQCQAMIENVLQYSIDTFPADVKAGNGRLFAYRTTKYNEADYDPLPREAQAKRRLTMLESEKQDYDITKITYLLKDRDSGTIDERKRELDNMKSLIVRNLGKLTSNLLSCVEFPEDDTRCLTVAQLELEDYDQSRLVLGSSKIVGPILGGSPVKDAIPFELMCLNFLKGAQGTSGDVINELALICDDGRYMAIGSTKIGSRNYKVECSEGQVITGMRGTRGRFDSINGLSFTCTNLAEMRAKAPSPTVSYAIIKPVGANDVAFDCPKGLAAVGFKGLKGEYVNQLQLICVSY